MADCPLPERKGDTNGALLVWALKLDDAGKACNDQLSALRAWRVSQEANPPE